jgi:hypothetical protein
MPCARKSPSRAYSSGVKTKLIRIGRARAVKIPLSFLRQAGLGESFHMMVRGNEIVLRKNKNPRAGWDKLFRQAGPAKLTQEDIEWLNAPLGPFPED